MKSLDNSVAVRRLQQDLKKLKRDPPLPVLGDGGSVWGMQAKPQEDNIMLWDVKMVAACGSLEGLVVSMRLDFPDTYPADPPHVTLLSRIYGHPNIFGSGICLDMLKNPEEYAKPYQGWSAAYEASSVLLQLYGFLLVDDTVDQMGGGARSGNGRRLAPAAAAAQPPPRSLPSPRAPQLSSGRSHTSGRAARPSSPCNLDKLDGHLIKLVLQTLDERDLLNCMSTEPCRLASLAEEVHYSNELVCFYSKAHCSEAVLGFGVMREWHQGNRASDLRSVVVRLDYLSLDSFVQSKVRRSAWNAPLDAFLPLYLNPEHGKRALSVLPSCVAYMLSQRTSDAVLLGKEQPPPIAPRKLLRLLAQAMNSLVVEMVRHDKGDVPMHMSDAALRGFAHLHHLLLAVALGPDGQALIQEARRDVRDFIQGGVSGETRHKEFCPDLGVLLVQLMLVPKEEVPWESFLAPFLRELLARQVLWAVRSPSHNVDITTRTPGCDCGQCIAAVRELEYQRGRRSSHTERWPGLAVVAGESKRGTSFDSLKRMRAQFNAGVTGLHTVQLTCWFGLEMARPRTVEGLQRDLQAVKHDYDIRSGAPRARVLAAFNAHARKVLAGKCWGAALQGLQAGLRCALDEQDGSLPETCGLMSDMLRQAVLDSWVLSYHNSPAPWGSWSRSRGRDRRWEGRWGKVYVRDEKRVRDVEQEFGRLFVEWEGERAPVGLRGARGVMDL